MTSDQRFSRLELLYGRDGLARMKEKSVAVFGLGGVGSHAAEALIRGGVGNLTLIDFDTVDMSNCNRQVHAHEGTIGKPKAQVMADRCNLINPDAVISPRQAFYNAETSDALLGQTYHYILDCIDHITAKLHLIETCINRQLPIISSMGAANKLDPTKIVVNDLAQTQNCRLARILRRELRKRGIETGVKTVYSTEEFRPLSGGRSSSPEGARDHYQTQRAPLGSSSVIPPVFGLMMAGEVIRDLIGRDI